MFSINPIPSEISKKIASRHKKLRKEAKFTQAELADRSGVSLGSIKRFEQTGKISFEFLLKLAHVLGRLKDFESLLQPKNNLEKIENLFSDKTRR